jgi:hypothetical protein
MVADGVRRGGGTPLVVFLTDGKANIARDGTADRALALRDAEAAAQAMKIAGVRALMIDLSDARGGPARKLAEAMGASYMPLPHADATLISKSVGAAMMACADGLLSRLADRRRGLAQPPGQPLRDGRRPALACAGDGKGTSAPAAARHGGFHTFLARRDPEACRAFHGDRA